MLWCWRSVISGGPVAKPWSILTKKYQQALRDYLRQENEEHLQQAYELGRIALNRGLGVLEMARLHQEALIRLIASLELQVATARQARAVEAFLLEALSPFEAAHRGFRRAWERLRQLNRILEQRNRQLAAINEKLGREVTERQRVENDLRDRTDHYLRLFEQARAMEENLRLLSTKVITAQEEERKHISRELHDEIGQTLTAVNVSLSLLKLHAKPDRTSRQQLARVQKLLTQSLENVHRFARELRPDMLDTLGPAAALRSYLKSFSKRTGIKAEMRSNANLARLDSQQGTVLYRVAQESLTNVFKHARASRVRVAFLRLPDGLAMEIRDNGRSARAQKRLFNKQNKRLGLLGMQERVRLVRGEFSVESTPGRGTTVRVRLPFSYLHRKVEKSSVPSSFEQIKSHEKNNHSFGR